MSQAGSLNSGGGPTPSPYNFFFSVPVGEVDVSAGGIYDVFTPTSNFVPTSIFIVTTGYNVVGTGAFTFSLGVTAPNYDDVVGNSGFSGMSSSVGGVGVADLYASGPNNISPSGQLLKLNVTGNGETLQTGDVFITGYYI